MDIYSLCLSIHAISWASWDYVSNDLSSEILHTDMNCFSCSPLRTRCNMSHLCTCWRAWDRGTEHLFTGGSTPPWAYKRHSVTLSEEVSFVAERHYHNGGQDAAKHRSSVKASCFRAVGYFSVEENLFCFKVSFVHRASHLYIYSESAFL